MRARVVSLLFANTTRHQILFKNSFWLGAADGVSRLIKFGVTLYVIRALGALEYGKFAIAFAFVSLFSTLFDFGMSGIVTREFAKNRDEERSFTGVLAWKLALGLVVVVLIVLGATFASGDAAVRLMIAVLALSMWIGEYSATYYAFFRAHQRMEYESWLAMAGAVGLGGSVLMLMWTLHSIDALSYAYLVSSVVALVGVGLLAGRKGYPLAPRPDRRVWRRYVAMAAPLAMAGLVASVYRFSDSVILGWLGQVEEAGFYNAALRIVGLAIIPMNLVLPVFLPALSAEASESGGRTRRLFEQQVELMIFGAFMITAVVFPLAPGIVEVAFSEAFAPAATALRITIFTALLLYLWSPFNQLLIVRDRQGWVFLVHFFGAGLNVALNLAFIPSLSFYGASIASVTSEFAILVLLIAAARGCAPSVVSLRGFGVACIPGVASGAAVSAILSVVSGSGIGFLFAAGLGGAALYSACFLGLRIACSARLAPDRGSDVTPEDVQNVVETGPVPPGNVADATASQASAAGWRRP